MNPLFKLILIAASCSLLINCSRMIKEEPYLEAEATEPLSPVANTDLPRSSNTLDIPAVKTTGNGIAPDSKPPEMTFARRRSSDENVVIVDTNGIPTIELYNNLSAWDLIDADQGENWQVINKDAENCQVTLQFNDPIIEDVENRNFFRKLVTFKSTYTDRSGKYILRCEKSPQKQQISLLTTDLAAPSSYVVDNLFTRIFDAAVEKTEKE